MKALNINAASQGRCEKRPVLLEELPEDFSPEHNSAKLRHYSAKLARYSVTLILVPFITSCYETTVLSLPALWVASMKPITMLTSRCEVILRTMFSDTTNLMKAMHSSAAICSVLLFTLSCAKPYFEHYSTSFTIFQDATPKQIPDSRSRISLVDRETLRLCRRVSVDQTQNKALFRIEDLETNYSTNYWVQAGGFFGSSSPTRGLKLVTVNTNSAVIERFRVRSGGR